MVKALITSLAFWLVFLIPGSALAAKLNQVSAKEITGGLAIDLNFDQPVRAKSMKPAYERNFIQFVLKGMKMDSARIVAAPGADATSIQKVFAYPYSPDTVRVRLIQNEQRKQNITVWNNNPRSVRIFIRNPQAVASGVSGVQKKAVPVAAAPAAAPSDEEKALLKEVIANTQEIDIHNPESVKNALQAKPETKAEDESNKGSIGTKAEPSKHFARMAIALFGILALFVGSVFLLKKYASKLKSLPFGKKERLIQVIASHYLGNKKSISLVKVTGEYMVVGVSNEGISLISKLGPEVNVDKYLEDRFWGGTFEKHLSSYSTDLKGIADLQKTDSVLIDPTRLEQKAQAVADRVELSPVTASIREKITKLKPLV